MVNRNRQASILIEVVVALGILTTAVLPLAFSFRGEHRLCRQYYYRAVAMEIVDGEMEVLAAGAWRAFGDGTHEYAVHAEAAGNLPPGKFVLTVRDRHLRLEWKPDGARDAAVIRREAVGR